MKLPNVRVEKREIQVVGVNAAVIFSFIKFANHPINYGWLAKCTGLSPRTIQRCLCRLKRSGFIERLNTQSQRLNIKVLKHMKSKKLHEYIYFQTTKGLTPTECLLKEAGHKARASKYGCRTYDSYEDDIKHILPKDSRTLDRRLRRVWNVIKSDDNYIMPDFYWVDEEEVKNNTVKLSDAETDSVEKNDTIVADEDVELCPTDECKNVPPKCAEMSDIIDKELKDKDNIKDNKNLKDNCFAGTNFVCAHHQVITATDKTTTNDTALQETVSPILLQRQLADYWGILAKQVGYGSVCGVDDMDEALCELQSRYGYEIVRRMMYEWFEGAFRDVRKPTGMKYGLRFLEQAEEIYKHVSGVIQVAVGE